MTREELLKIAKPILFNTEMVQAILEGRKTCTRRIVNPQPNIKNDGNIDGVKPQVIYISWENFINHKAPYQIGDILYIRETWLKADDGYHYRADETPVSKEIRESYGYKWKPSIHMPKELARIFLKVTDVRVERLQDITEEQARKEGCITYSDKVENKQFKDVLEFDLTAKDAFIELWKSTIKKQDLDRYGWEANPFVWVIEFERVEVK